MSYESDWLNEPLYHGQEQADILEKAEAQYWGKIITAGEGRLRILNGKLLCAIPDLDILAYNRVLGFRHKKEITRDFLNEVILFYQKAGSRRCMIQIPERLLDEEVILTLQSAGFRQHNAWSKLALSLDDYKPKTGSSHHIIEITEDLQSIQFGQIIQESFDWPEDMKSIFMQTCGVPGFRHFLLKINGIATSVAAMHITGDVVSMAIAGTIPEYRGHGAQKALLDKRLSLAKELGCKLATTETGVNSSEKPNISWLNMAKTGFKEAYIRYNFVREF